MQVTRTSLLTGIKRTLEIACTPEQLESWSKGEDLIQNIMPQLTDSEREFVMTGVTDDEWDEAMQVLEEYEEAMQVLEEYEDDGSEPSF